MMAPHSAPQVAPTHDKPIQMRGSYPVATKKATLMHELGHRLQSELFRASENDHPFLFLWLYSAWVEAYGDDFAKEQVAVEKRRGGVYPAAWDAALALSVADRAVLWDSVRSSRMRRDVIGVFSPRSPTIVAVGNRSEDLRGASPRALIRFACN